MRNPGPDPDPGHRAVMLVFNTPTPLLSFAATNTTSENDASVCPTVPAMGMVLSAFRLLEKRAVLLGNARFKKQSLLPT